MTRVDQIHRAADRRFAAWKNGGGQTAEILCHPEGAGFDDFGWRISTARVGASGPFSTFAGVTRCLCVITGGTLALAFPGRQTVRLDPQSAPFTFPGDIACDCTLTGAEVLDLNVMVRAPCRLSVRRGSAGADAQTGTALRFVFALRDLPQLGLARHDLARLAPASPTPTLTGDEAIIVTITGG